MVVGISGWSTVRIVNDDNWKEQGLNSFESKGKYIWWGSQRKDAKRGEAG